MAFYALERLMNLYDGYRQSFVVAGQPVLLIQEQSRRVVIQNLCPHMQASLDRASIHDGLIQCPAHGMRFDLNSGQCLDACENRLKFIPISYDGNQLGVVVN